jgi:hypothetical protein
MRPRLFRYIVELDGESRLQLIDAFGYKPEKEDLVEIIKLCADMLSKYEQLEDHNAYVDHCHENRLNPSTGKRYAENQHKARSGGTRPGYVYIAQDESLEDTYKIGYSIKPDHRERTLQAQKPTIIFIHAEIGTIEQERQIHSILSDKRIRGEWFKAPIGEIIDAFNQAFPYVDLRDPSDFFMPNTSFVPVSVTEDEDLPFK